jgi:hypothetical protein
VVGDFWSILEGRLRCNVRIWEKERLQCSLWSRCKKMQERWKSQA